MIISQTFTLFHASNLPNKTYVLFCSCNHTTHVVDSKQCVGAGVRLRLGEAAPLFAPRVRRGRTFTCHNNVGGEWERVRKTG